MNGLQRCPSKCFRGYIWFAGGDTQLIEGMSEEADGATADGAVVAELGAVAGGVQPVFKHVVCIGATVSADAVAHFLHIRAGNAGIGMGPGISANSLFTGMGKGAYGPIVDKSFSTGDDLQDEQKIMGSEQR